MSIARSAVALLGTAASIVALTLGACSDDAVSQAPAPASDASAPDTSLPPRTAASITPRPDLCEGLTRGPDPVPELELGGDPPAPLGGKLMPGTYDLVEVDTYAGASTMPAAGGDPHGPSYPRLTGQAAQSTLVVTEFAMRTIDARGKAGTPLTATTRAVLYRVDGMSLVETAVCPATALPVSIPFSAVGNGIAIFADPKHRELYVRR